MSNIQIIPARWLGGAVVAFLVAVTAPAQATSHDILVQPLPAPFGGRMATLIEVTIPPGPGSKPHRHPGIVLGYVLEGELRFQVEGEPERILKPGEAFYEPPLAAHLVAASALPDKAVKFLVVVLGKKDEPITARDP